MAKTKTKFKGVVKGAALGFALIMAGSFVPANAIASAVDYETGDKARLNTSRIEVDGQNQSFSVKRGETVSIPEAEYVYKTVSNTTATHVIGGAVADSITESKVEVYYKATGDKVAENAVSFVAERVGTYVIAYTVVDNGVPYSYEQLVSVEASEASFEFVANDKNVIPAVYDVAVADGKDIVLPLPTVNDDEDEAILTGEDEDYYVLSATDIPTGQDAKKTYVKVSLANGSEKVSIQERTNAEGKKEFYISGEDLSELDDKDEAVLNGEDVKIFYSFYQKTENGDVFVSSTSKTFTIKTNYYYTDSDKDTAGYNLVASFSGSKPDSAVVGVEKDLPKITATTSSTNTPANETVEAYYDIVVYKQNANGNYKDENAVTEKVITEDGKFKATEEGSYKFIYKVKDFYGNSGTESATTFEIKNVKDTLSAKAYIYDASNQNAYDSENNVYQSAENILKNQTVNRNIIMYAVGGTDNMVKRYEDLTAEEKENDTNYISLRREIKDNSGITRFVVDNEAYNNYNLIFAPRAASGSTTSVLQTIVKDNYNLYKDMITAENPVDVTNDDQIKEYLLENNYLLVTTTFNKDIKGNDIVDGLTEDDEEATAKMLAEGYAYVAPKTANYSFEDKEGTFTFYYFANDNVNNNKEASIYFSVKLANSFEDVSVPTITFSSDLQTAYLPSETFEFNVASATDSIASRLTTVTAYRFLDSTPNKTPMPANEEAKTTTKLEYVVMNANTSLMKPVAEGGKWYAQEGIVKSEGWFVDSETTSYKVDLSKRPAGAGYVEILAYAIDDYGNVGFFNKVIKIADTTDTEAPVLYKVMNAPETTAYTAPSTITLPTLYFSDANANYMHAEVNVYKLVKDGQGKITGKTLVQSSGMKTTYDTQREYFKVDAGVFNATTEGDYQVAVSVIDSGNHSVTSYFAYNVEAGESTETPKIDNITSDAIELEPGKAHYLVPPTFTMIENAKYGYVGIEEDDDAYTSTYYNVSVISATSNDYKLDESYFIGNSEGTYQLQYTAFLIQYEKSALVAESDKANGKLFFKNGKLMYNDGAQDYYVYIDQDKENTLTANTSLQGEGTALADMTTLNEIAKVYVDQSDAQIIKVSEVFIKVSIDEDAYAQDAYENLNNEVKIVKPSVEFKGNGAEMNKKESTVTISRTSGGTTTTVATINFEDWQKSIKDNTSGNFRIDGNDIYLIMKDHGEYKIKYSIQAQAGGQNIGDPNTDYVYTIASGDTKKPTIEVDNKNIIKEKYSIGDKVVINMNALTIKDNMTSEDILLGKLTVTIKNTTLNESAKTLENKATEEGSYVFESDKLETAGDYVITFTVRDEAGNISEETTVKFEVSTDKADPISAKEVMGGVLIGISVALLVGVVGYFVVSKVKLDKKEKSARNSGKDRK